MSGKTTDLQRLLDWLDRQVGTTESPPGSNNVVYNTIYYGGPVSGAAYPWCCAFVWVGFSELGLSSLFCGGEKTAYCPFVVNWARQHGAWVTGGYRVGDLALYDWNGDGVADHIGVIVAVSGSQLTTIEGNVNEAVCRLTRSSAALLGACRPVWPSGDDAPAEDDTTPPAPPYRPGDRYMVQTGDTLWGIAEKTLGNGAYYFQIKQANNMTSDMIYPGQVLIIPRGDQGEITVSVTIKDETYARLKIMAEGWGKTIGQVIDALTEDGE